MVRDTIQLEDAISTISQEYLLEFTFEYGIPESLHLELSGPEECIIEFLKVKVSVYIRSFERAGVEISTGNVATTEVWGLFSSGSPKLGKSSSIPSIGGLPEDIYQSGWGVTNNCRLDTPEACQDMVDHIVPSRVAKAESNDLRNQTKNLKIVLEAEVDMKKAVSDLQAQVTGEEKMKAAFEEFKRYEDDKVEQRCAEMDARLDKLSVDFNEELYPHMLTAIARGLAKGMSKGLKHGIKHGRAGRDLADIEAYDPLERLKDAPIDVIMASLYLESDSGEAAPQWIRELRPSSSQLNIPVYTEVRGLKDPWSFKEEILLEDAIAANISRV
nr:hypothetical protein [Tanacetum cinerariifolium]